MAELSRPATAVVSFYWDERRKQWDLVGRTNASGRNQRIYAIADTSVPLDLVVLRLMVSAMARELEAQLAM